MNARRAFLGAVIVALVVGIGLPVLFGEPARIADRTGGDPWRNAVYDFQTLITGIFAVGAAWWTVAAMERTERAEARRHSDQIELAMRADKLKLDRAIYPQLLDLQNCHENFQKILSHYKEAMKRATKDEPAISFVVDDIFQEVDRVVGILKRPHFVEGGLLFDGDLNNRVWDLSWRAERALERASYACKFYGDGDPDPGEQFYFEHIDDDDNHSMLVGFCLYSVEFFPSIFEGMRRMTEMYGLSQKA